MNFKNNNTNLIISAFTGLLAILTLIPNKKAERENYMGYKSVNRHAPISTGILALVSGFFAWLFWNNRKK